jgi:hypothetical protein
MERTKQQGLNDLVTKNIQRKLEKGMLNVQAATSRLMEEGKIAKDFIFEVGTTRKGIETNINFIPNVGKVGAKFNMPTGVEDFTIHPHAIRQVAEKLQIPTKYLTELLFASDDWKQTLGYQILNTHNGWLERNKVLVRAVGTEVRAFLSDQYRRLDSERIFGTHIDAVFECGGALSDGFMDDTRVMIESIRPKPIEIQTVLNGIILIAFGTRTDSSDYGDGALNLRSFILNGACLNGAVRQTALRTVHLGAKLPANIGLSNETYELDSKATASAVRDLTRGLYSDANIKDRVLEIQASAEDRIDPVTAIKQLFLAGKIFKGEQDKIGELLMRNDPRQGIQGEATLWKLAQGVSAFANTEEIEPRRRMELQEVAGDLLKKAI